MKYLKVVLLAIVAVCTFASAEAQVNVRIGDHHRPYHRRAVVVHHRYHRHHDVVVVRHRY